LELEVAGRQVYVTLSRRNLMTLLTKLEHPESARTIYRDFPDIGCTLVLKAEPDDIHYRNRTPGPMADWTEREINGR